MNTMLFGTLLTPDEKADRLLTVARSLLSSLLAGSAIDRAALTGLMTATFGTSDAGGAWTMRDAYDAIEVTQVLAMGDPVSSPVADEHDATLARLTALTGQGPRTATAPKRRSSCSSSRHRRRWPISPRPQVPYGAATWCSMGVSRQALYRQKR